MKRSFSPAVMLALTSLVPLASAATIGQIDTFQSGTTEGWFAGGLGFGSIPPVPPKVIANGGPLGAGDQFLQITSQGGTGPGSRLVAINLSQWAGDYLHSGISGIGMDLRNIGDTDLTIRLLLEDPMMAPPNDEAVTTFGAFLPAGGDWTHVFFQISPASMTAILGDVTTLLANTTLLRIIDSPTPGEAVPIAGILGVDNIEAEAVPEPATFFLGACVLGGIVACRRRSRRVKPEA